MGTEAKNHWTKNIKFNFTTNMAPKVKLTYFNLRGRAEPTRMLLAYGGIEYEDCRVTPGFVDPTEWMALKPKTPYGSLHFWNGMASVWLSPWQLPDLWLRKLALPADVTWSVLRWMRLWMLLMTLELLEPRQCSPRMMRRSRSS